MEHAMEMQVMQEIVDKLRKLMAMEVQEETEGVEGKEFTQAAPEMIEELGEALGEEDKAESAEASALGESEGGYKEDMKKFFGGGKPVLPGKKGLKVGVTEIAVMPKPKAKAYK